MSCDLKERVDRVDEIHRVSVAAPARVAVDRKRTVASTYAVRNIAKSSPSPVIDGNPCIASGTRPEWS